MPTHNPYAPPGSPPSEAPKQADLRARRGADASLSKRFGGMVIDSIALFVGMTVLSRAFCALTGAEKTFGLLQMFLVVVLVGQWFLIPQRGQTLGKMALRTRIVLADGELPGFVRGVVVEAVAALRGPDASLTDAARCSRWRRSSISRTRSSSSRGSRCLHDCIAGTYVVDAPL